MLLPHLSDRMKSILIVSTYVYTYVFMYVKVLSHVTIDTISFCESILITVQMDSRVTKQFRKS